MSELSDDQKKQLIQGYLQQFALDAYGHSMNRHVAVEQNNVSAVYKADLALYDIQVATITYQRELDILNGLEPDPIVLPDPPVDPNPPESFLGPLPSQPN